jgi:3-oxoacyl-[acyl-carrier protein] reductase
LTKTLLIVGGSSGIGAATLDLALLRGHRVIQASRHPELACVAPEVTSLAWDACGGEFPAQSLPDVLDGLVYCTGASVLSLSPASALPSCGRIWRSA